MWFVSWMAASMGFVLGAWWASRPRSSDEEE